MPIVHGRLTCFTCGNDLGDANDPYRDPNCEICEQRWLDSDSDYDALNDDDHLDETES
jgi:hypothetical protein